MKFTVYDKTDSGNVFFRVNLDFAGVFCNSQKNQANVELVDGFFACDFFKCFFTDGVVGIKNFAGGYFREKFI